METLSKEQFSYQKFSVVGKDITKSYPFADDGDSYEVTFTDINGSSYTAEIKDLYSLKVFQFETPKQEDLEYAKNWVIERNKK